MTSCVTTSRAAATAASGCIVLSPLSIGKIDISKATRTCRRSRGRTHAHVRHRTLVSSVGGRCRVAHATSHRHAKLLLLTHLGLLELAKLIRVRRDIQTLHLALQLLELVGQLLLLWYHAHVDILLVCGGNLLLLLLEHFDLLSERELFH